MSAIMTWLSANSSVDSCWFFESLIPVMSCFSHLVIMSSKYILNSVGERGQPWRTHLLISTGFDNFDNSALICLQITHVSECFIAQIIDMWTCSIKFNYVSEVC